MFLIKRGEGCIREIIEQVLRVQGNWKFILKNLLNELQKSNHSASGSQEGKLS